MSCASFVYIQLASIKSAVDMVAESLKVEKDDDRLIVTRTVSDIAAEIGFFYTNKLVEMALEQ